ncbi:MAG: LacI family transcriptional regulator [Glaciihabitans sp.]|nr:LacI family transcriptional regulator [Glaciihabitans sp.]
MKVPSNISRPTIYDVAHHANVSKSLVSLVLRGSPNVSEKRRAAVLKSIAELGYAPSKAAATLAGNRSHTIGVVIDDYRNLWFVDLLDGIRKVMDHHGYTVTVSDRHPSGSVGLDAVSGFISMNVDGIVVATEPGGLPLENLSIPTVIAGGRETQPPAADVVANDDSYGAALAVAHLLELGHRRIGHVSGAGGSAARRRVAFEAKMAESDLPAPVYGAGNADDERTGYLATLELFQAHPDTTAIFAANDTMAFGALGALRELGLAVPRDVSLVGYDNSPLGASKYLDLTTVDDRSFPVGVEVATALLARIANPTLVPKSTLIRPALVVRSSTAVSGT